MACRDTYRTNVYDFYPEETDNFAEWDEEQLLFGVDSRIETDDKLQNNISLFEWAKRNKIYPSFWGRNITGENCLTKSEIDYLHDKACSIAAIYSSAEAKETEEMGEILAKDAVFTAFKLGIPAGRAIFLEIDDEESLTTDFMRGFAKTMIADGYTPAFRANTDSEYVFDREYSRGMQTDREVFEKCLIWATAPTLEEYDEITTTHLIHPDNWKPYAPSGITRKKISVWQYGKDCHPICDDDDREITFNINLIRSKRTLIGKMF